ncbi:hypothetical protein BVRB_7g161670 [Beta vulgaris subsp. vulgaris]|nr:hypothetical protein BVRB_7g161670 [Beta vulgaris subsp. vulgaris]
MLEAEPTPTNIEEFSSGLLHGTVPMFFKSKGIPDNDNTTVQIAVGKTFNLMTWSSATPRMFFLRSTHHGA